MKQEKPKQMKFAERVAGFDPIQSQNDQDNSNTDPRQIKIFDPEVLTAREESLTSRHNRMIDNCPDRGGNPLKTTINLEDIDLGHDQRYERYYWLRYQGCAQALILESKTDQYGIKKFYYSADGPNISGSISLHEMSNLITSFNDIEDIWYDHDSTNPKTQKKNTNTPVISHQLNF